MWRVECKKSAHYLNCKPVSLNGTGLQLISNLFLDLIDPNSKAVAGLTLGADPLVSGVIVTAASKGLTLDALIIRKEIKAYGTKAGLEGPTLNKGTLVTVLEDVVTTAGSAIKDWAIPTSSLKLSLIKLFAVYKSVTPPCAIIGVFVIFLIFFA